jgi:putative redox protein
MTLKINNLTGEKLDVLIEGNLQAKTTVIFVHGFAVDKHETAGYFDDLVIVFGNNYRIIRFDFSGCGESEGNLEEKDYEKWADDLKIVVDYVKKTYKGSLYIFAQSMGCFVIALANPTGIKKTIFTGIPNNNTQLIIDRISKRFLSRPGGSINYEGISYFPRSTGKVQEIGPTFWKVLKDFNPYKTVEKYSKKTNLFIIHPKQDEIVGSEFLEEYSMIPKIRIEWIDGDHSFTKKEDRENLIVKIKDFFGQ